jgi:hypothetical protein
VMKDVLALGVTQEDVRVAAPLPAALHAGGGWRQ